MSYSKKALYDYMTVGKKIFFAPSMLLNSLRLLIKNANLNGFLEDVSAPTYTLRVVGKYLKNSFLYIRIQVIGTRAIFDMHIANLYSAKEVLSQIDPFNLIDIGYLYKGCELESSAHEKCTYHKDSPLIKKLSAYAKKKDPTKNYHLRIISHKLDGSDLSVSIRMLNSLTTFDIPIKELEKDFFLLGNIEPGDLIRIGYIAKEEEIKNNITYLHGSES